jgi:hypothetical protein
MSSFQLDDQAKSLLSKGNKFTPTSRMNSSKLTEDITDFIRRVRIHDYFSDTTQSNELDLKFQKSDFTPAKGKNIDMDNLLNILENRSINMLDTTNTPQHNRNLSAGEFNALKQLQTKSNLHITTADKGGAIVILDYKFYRDRIIHEHLSDTNTYAKIEENNKPKVLNKICNLCNKYRTTFTEKEFKYLTKFHPTTPFLYGLPKIHKHIDHFVSTSPDNFNHIMIKPPVNLKFRPIISSRFNCSH